MAVNIGINGFGRTGHLVMRVAAGNPDIRIVRISDPAVGDGGVMLRHRP